MKVQDSGNLKGDQAEIALLESTARRLAEGDFSARVALPLLDNRQDLVARLARSLNRLAESLESQAARLPGESGQIPFPALVERMEDGVLLVELPSRRVAAANSAARRLLDWGDSDGRTLAENNPAEAALLELVNRVSSQQNGSVEGEFTTGSKVARVRAALARDSVGEPTACLFTLVDMTREREVERLREDLSSMIVHDLRTPLTMIIGSLETLASTEGQGDAARQELVEIGLSGGRSLLGLVNTLLDISRLESGEVPIEKAEVKVQEVVEAALAQVVPLAREAQIEVATELTEDLPSVWAEREKIQRVLVNLLGNAVKFTPAEGRITISACDDRARGWVLISVEDTGEGIPQEYCERIFDKFEQVANRKAGRKMSTGLGLTFCKLAVEAHGGRIWVESPLFPNAPDDSTKGSRFTFSLPIYPGD